MKRYFAIDWNKLAAFLGYSTPLCEEERQDLEEALLEAHIITDIVTTNSLIQEGIRHYNERKNHKMD